MIWLCRRIPNPVAGEATLCGVALVGLIGNMAWTSYRDKVRDFEQQQFEQQQKDRARQVEWDARQLEREERDRADRAKWEEKDRADRAKWAEAEAKLRGDKSA